MRDEFAQKCRDEKFVVREFVYDEAAVEKQNQDLVELEASEKELWVGPIHRHPAVLLYMLTTSIPADRPSQSVTH